MYIWDGKVHFKRNVYLGCENRLHENWVFGIGIFYGMGKYASVELRIWKEKVYFRRTSCFKMGTCTSGELPHLKWERVLQENFLI